MQKRVVLLFLFCLGLGVWWISKNYLLIGVTSPLEPGKVFNLSNPPGSPGATDVKSNTQTASVSYRVESFAEGLQVPWSMVFTAPNRLLVTERPGIVRQVVDGKLLAEPVRSFPEVSQESEEGLMGMVLDPEYATNKQLYLCVAYQADGKTFDKIIRVTDAGTTLNQDTMILDKIPAAQFHAGCRLRIGPDNKLYISTGDATNKQIAQDLQSLGGKILRLNLDGSIPADNPFPNSLVYSYGHRNPQGFDWQPDTNIMVATEHGPSGNDGPGGGDEVNLITAGQNYGWPVVSHTNSKVGMVDPLLVFTPAIAPASGMFYRGTVFPQFTNTFLFGALKGQGMIQVVFNPDQPGKVASYQKLPQIEVGRIRDVMEGPDGLLYFTTSNRDGRGSVKPGDDKIYRLVPTQ